MWDSDILSICNTSWRMDVRVKKKSQVFLTNISYRRAEEAQLYFVSGFKEAIQCVLALSL